MDLMRATVQDEQADCEFEAPEYSLLLELEKDDGVIDVAGDFLVWEKTIYGWLKSNIDIL
jgi:hypothetical protein